MDVGAIGASASHDEPRCLKMYSTCLALRLANGPSRVSCRANRCANSEGLPSRGLLSLPLGGYLVESSEEEEAELSQRRILAKRAPPLLDEIVEPSAK